MREQDLEFNPEYKYSKGGKVEKYIIVRGTKESEKYYYQKGTNEYDYKWLRSKKDATIFDNIKQAEKAADESDGDIVILGTFAKGGKISDETYREVYYAHLYPEYDSMEQVKRDVNRLMKRENISMEELLNEIPDQYAKGGKTKKFPVAVKRRVDEINQMLPKVNESGDYASTYAGSTMESYIILDKPIQIKGNYVYISEKDSRWGKYGFEKRYNVNDTRDVYESIKGRKALMSDLGIIKRAFTKLLKSEGKMAKGGEVKETSSQFKKRSEKDSVRIYNAWKKVLDSNFGDKEYQKFEKLVKDTQIPQYSVEKITNYTSTTPRGKQKLIDIYQYWGKSEYAKGGIAKKSEYISNRDIVSLTHKKGGTKKTLKGSQLVDGAYAKKKIMRKKPTKSDQLSLLNKGGEIVRAYDVNVNSGVGTYAKGGKMQGYNSRLDESLAMRKGAKRTKQQSDKDRRDESKAMSKSMGRRAYAGVRGMDKGRRKMAVGGKTTMAGDTDFPSELLNYAKGGYVRVDNAKAKPHKIVEYKNGIYISKDYIPYDYDVSTIVFFVSDDKGNEYGQFPTLKLAKEKFNKALKGEAKDYAKGGKTKGYEVFVDFGDEIGTQTIATFDTKKDAFEYRTKVIKNPSNYEDKNSWQGRPSDIKGVYIDSLTSDSYAKGGKFASGGNVSYNGWTNYATWVTSLEILDGIDWEEYNMGEPISAEQIEDYVQEVMEQSPNLALSFANRFLNDVNYREIAENANDDFDLDDGEKDEYAKGGQMKKPMIRYSGRR